MPPEEQYAIVIFTNIVCLVALFAHLIGLYLLRVVTNFPHNQRLILAQLSIVETIQLILNFFTVTTMTFPVDIFAQEMILLLQAFFLGVAGNLTIIFLTVNRFLEVHLHMYYPTKFTNKKVKIVLILIWLLATVVFCLVLIWRLIYKVNMLYWLNVLAYPLVNGIVILICIFVYTYIYVKLRKIKNEMRTVVHKNHGTSSSSNIGHYIPLYIIISNIIFVVIPQTLIATLFYALKMNKYGHPMYPISIVMFELGFLSDAAIYIFANKLLRTTLKRRFSCIGIDQSNTVSTLS